MARRLFSSRGRARRRRQNWVYIILALLIIAVAIAFIYYGPYPSGKSSSEPLAPPIDINEEYQPEPTIVKAPKPEPPVEPNLLEIPKPAEVSNPQVAERIAEAMTLLNAKPRRIIEARDRLNEALPMPMSGQQRDFVKDRLSELAEIWLFSKTIFPADKLCSSYKVKPDDQLRLIAQQFKVPWEILLEINKIPRPEALRAGETIKVTHGPFHARIYRSTFMMDLYLQNTFVRSFPVGLGKPGMETPTGLWVVKPGGKLIKPVWTDPISGETYHPESQDYPLGSRWIGLEGVSGQAKGRTGFAIHGTKKPEEIGSAGSQGCIRLHNGDAILLYNLLTPGLSQVKVVE